MTKGYLPPLVQRHFDHVEYLAINGYFGGDFPEAKKLKETDPLFQQATIEFQEFAGLVPDGDFGPVSENRTTDKRCALPDLDRGFVKDRNGNWKEFAIAEACTRKWSDAAKNSLTCCHNSMSFSTLSAADTDKAWWQGMVEWMKVCDVTFKRVPFSRNANFTHDKESIDGRSGTLAYHYLPSCGSGSGASLGGRYDSGERWTANFFQGVHVHEVGHGLGLGHSSSRSDILYPYYNSKYTTPQPGDARRVVALYGKPKSTPPEPGPPDEPTDFEARLSKVEREVMINRAAIEILARRQ